MGGFSVDPDLKELLQLSTVDAPVATHTSSAILPADIAEELKAEDKKAEMILHKTHQAAAWQIRSATVASFFNQASLIWLRQMQGRFPPGETRLHQDVNKLMAATEFSADATLNTVKFLSRALASTVTLCHLLWLCHWQADMRSKWRLALAPYKGANLFGKALDPILIENKDKRKSCPT